MDINKTMERKGIIKICFYVRTKNRELFEIVDFYSNDIRIFKELGYEVVLSNSYKNIPNDCDLYFIWWWTSGIVPLIKAKFLRKPTLMIGNLHYSDSSIQGFKNKPFYIRAFIKYCLRNSDVQLATSKFEFNEILNLKPKNLKMIYHAIDLGKYEFRSYDNREPFLFSLTHLTKHNVKRKCVLETIEAFKIVNEKFKEIKLYIAGGTDSEGYEMAYHKVKSLGLEDKIVFMGRISEQEKISMYQKCRIYIQPTYFEGFGMAIAESMACGAPVITSPKGAVPEIVADCTLFVVPDDINNIADGIMKLIEDNDFAKELGVIGRKRIEEMYSFEKRKNSLKLLIESILKKEIKL